MDILVRVLRTKDNETAEDENGFISRVYATNQNGEFLVYDCEGGHQMPIQAIDPEHFDGAYEVVDENDEARLWDNPGEFMWVNPANKLYSDDLQELLNQVTIPREKDCMFLEEGTKFKLIEKPIEEVPFK